MKNERETLRVTTTSANNDLFYRVCVQVHERERAHAFLSSFKLTGQVVDYWSVTMYNITHY